LYSDGEKVALYGREEEGEGVEKWDSGGGTDASELGVLVNGGVRMLGKSVAKISYSGRFGDDIKGSWALAKGWGDGSV